MRFDEISNEQFHTIRDRMLPHLARRGKQRAQADMLAHLALLWPARLDFEIARVTGDKAFDVGEAGFTYTKGDQE